MVDFIKKYNTTIMVSLISIMIVFLGLTFLVRKDKISLSEHQKRLRLYDQVQDGDEAISGTDYVTFDAFFLEDLDNDGNADGIRGNSLEIGKKGELKFEIKILGDAKLTNGKISFVNSNVKVSGTIKKGSLVSTTQSSTDFRAIDLKELNNGTTVPLTTLAVDANLTNDLNSYTGINKIILTGTVHNNITGEDTDIIKEVPYTVDWYGDKINAKIYSASNSGDFDYTNPTVTYTIISQETAGQLFLKTAYLEATISQLNGEYPFSVTIDDPNVTYSYDPATRKLTARRDAILDGTLITKQAYNYKNNLSSYNDWNIKVTYAVCGSCDIFTDYYTNINATIWYDAFNNQGSNYDSVKTSNKVSRIVSAKYKSGGETGVVPNPDQHSTVIVGNKSTVLNAQYVDKTDAMSIYNGTVIDNSTTDYKVNWKVFVPVEVKNKVKDGVYTMTLDDVDGDSLSNDISIKDYTKYKSISFGSLDNVLGTNGYIILKNKDTNEVIHIFTALDWNTPYTFDDDVRSINLELGEFKDNTGVFDVYLVKTIDNNKIFDNISYDSFNEAGSINSNLNVSNYKDNSPLVIDFYGHQPSRISRGTASYLEATSRVFITSNKTQIYTTEATDIVFNIKSNDIDELAKGFKDGEFYILLPDGILDASINSINTNDSDVTIERKEIGTLANGQKYIKIVTNNNDAKKIDINISINVIPDIRKVDTTASIALYAYNPNCHNYIGGTTDIYDINSNNDTTEKIASAYTNITIAAPNEMITTSILKEYSSDSITVAPMIAEVNPVEDDPEATVEIGITNNSEYNAKNVRIIGKVAYDDNTYQIGTGSLGSKYDVHMTDDGISIPTELDGLVTIYYSEVETPTDDINDVTNNWTLKENTDFTKVKSYLIIFNDYEMEIGKNFVFTYDIEMPMTTQNLNKETYFTHGVYFDLVTSAGLYASSVGGSKLGIRMSRQYDVELTDLKAFSNQKIAGTQYLFEDEEGNQKTLVTDNDGKITLKDLYVGKEYTLKQISINSPYVIDEETKTFKLVNSTNDEITISSNGTLKSISLTNDKKLVIEHENETRYDLVLTNTDLDNGAAVAYSKFKITGKGYESGITLLTSSDGSLSLKNLYLNESYEIEQISANKYLLTNKFNVRLMRDSNNEIKIAITKVPQIGEIVTVTNGYTTDYDSDYGMYYKPISSSRRWYQSYIPIDMTELTGTYKLIVPYKYYSYYSNNTFSMYLSNRSDDYYMEFLYKSTDTSNSDLLRIAETTQYYDATDYQAKDIVGGQIYYLYLSAYNYNSLDYYLKIFPPQLELTNGEVVEYAASASNQNVVTFENSNAYQTLVDNGVDAPVLRVNVKNRAIPTYTLEITKKDAETGQPLAGAQYRITGSGLPTEGSYLTTDANGKISIELQKKYDNGNSNYYYVNGIDYNQYGTEYTIEEVVAPIGYTLDSKKVTFSGTLYLQNGTMDWNQQPYNYTTDLATETDNVLNYSLTTEGKFKEAVWDGNTLKVTMQDYPIITITKKDAETGEVLPNTQFSIFKVERVNGQEILTPALNSKGKVVGNELTIEGKDYYIVQTNAEGKLTLDLGAGQYKLKEIQAADEKYELSNAEYYFGVGETVPHQEPGMDLVDIIAANGSFNGSYYSQKYVLTNDDGIAYTTCSGSDCYLVKKDQDGNIEWQVDAYLKIAGSAYVVHYFDDPDREDYYVATPYNYPPIALVATSDGGFIVSYPREGGIVKFDANGNRLWQNQQSRYNQYVMMDKVCTYDGNTDANGNVRLYDYVSYDGTTFTEQYRINYIYNPDTGNYDESNYFDISHNTDDFWYAEGFLRDNDTYYCHMTYSADSSYDQSKWLESEWNPGEYEFKGEDKYINNIYSNGGAILETNDGGVLFFYHNYNRYYDNPNPHYYSSHYYLRLSDGTMIPHTWTNTIIRYDANGNSVGAYNLDELVYNAELEYINKYNLSTSNIYAQNDNYNDFTSGGDYFGIKSYPNGDILFVGYNGFVIKLRYNEQTDKFETVFFTPVGVNGIKVDRLYSSGDHLSEIKIKDDGGFAIGYEATAGYSSLLSPYSTVDSYYDTEVQHLDLNHPAFYRQGDYNTVDPIFEFDGEGKLSNLIIATSSDRNLASHPDDIQHIHGYNYGASYNILDDGNYLFTLDTRSIYNYVINGVGVRIVELASGEIEEIKPETTYIVYLTNKDGKIEWIKQYKGINSIVPGYHYIKSFITHDDKYYYVPVMVNGTEFEDLETGEIYQAEEPGVVNFLKFEFIDEIQPSGPEAYTLDIENKRKEYKVTATSNIGGEVVVTNPDNGQNVISTTGTTTTLEKVKYGDTNKYDITIIPDSNYVVAGVKVNGKDIPYTVNADGSVTLNKIEDIKEDKNISIIYAKNKSQVIVKHYLKGTTTSVFGDDILTGDSGDPYETEPKVSDLYSLAKDENGEIILPSNMADNFAATPITVIYYYQENEVDLKVNYYLDGTDTELAPSSIQRKTLGSSYQTAPLSIPNYNYTRTIGDSSGVLNNNTEVTFMYQESNESTITIKYVDKATNQDIIPPIVKTVTRHDTYTTDDPVTIPSNYRFTNVVGTPDGTAEDANIEVIYYYEVIPFNVSVNKKINSILLNGEKQTITDSKNVTITPAKKDNLIVYYEINLKNTGDIKANFTVVEEDIPGFVIYDKGNFTKTNNGYELTAELEPGEEKSYRIGYKWNQKDYGISTNKVELKEVTNDKGFDEPDALDNISTATIETKISKDVLDDQTIIPNTLDNIPTMITLLIASIIGIITSLILIRKRRMN